MVDLESGVAIVSVFAWLRDHDVAFSEWNCVSQPGLRNVFMTRKPRHWGGVLCSYAALRSGSFAAQASASVARMRVADPIFTAVSSPREMISQVFASEIACSLANSFTRNSAGRENVVSNGIVVSIGWLRLKQLGFDRRTMRYKNCDIFSLISN